MLKMTLIAASVLSFDTTGIAKKFSAIEANADLAPKSFKFYCEADISGGKVDLYQQDEKLLKAVVETFHPGEGGSEKYRFYYDKELIFALASTVRYKSLDSEPLMEETQVRYYFDKNRPVKCLKKTATAISKNLPEALDHAANIQHDCANSDLMQKLASTLNRREAGKDELRSLLFRKCPS